MLYYLHSDLQQRKDHLYQQIQQNLNTAYNAVVNLYGLFSGTIYIEIINKPEVINLFAQAYAADAEQRAAIRSQLYAQLRSTYTHLTTHNLKQLHFHLPDNTSFLRMHRPNKFGDNLSAVRYSVKKVNETHKFIQGFEEGRIFNGFRYVYPLSHQNKHIGSVEISISFQAIRNQIEQLFPVKTSFILKKSVVQAKVFDSELKNYISSTLHPDFLYEKSIYARLHGEKQGLFSANTLQAIHQKIQSQAQSLLSGNDMFSVYANTRYSNFIVTFLPIYNIEGEHVAYMLMYKHDKELSNYIRDSWIKFFVSTLLIIALFVWFHYFTRGQQLQTEIVQRRLIEAELREAKNQAEAANIAKSQFFANMSHELRTPLNAINGYSEMLQEELIDFAVDEELLEDLTKIQTASHRLLNIINDVLDLSRIETGKMEIFAQTFCVSDLVQALDSQFVNEFQQNHNTLDINMSKDIGDMYSDYNKISKILANLLSNATKFCEKQHITFNINRIQKLEHDWIIFEVIDHGIGMTDEQIKHSFQAFTQVDYSTTRKYGGMGLGLAIVKNFSQMLGGDVEVKSQYGSGSTFTVYLPAQLNQQNVIVNAPEIALSQQNNRALLINASVIECELYKGYLMRLGYKVEVTDSGHMGLVLAEQLMPKVILLDIILTDISGWDVLEELKAKPKLATIPVILTLEVKPSDWKIPQATCYLTKPISREDCTLTIGNIENWDMQDANDLVMIVDDDEDTCYLLSQLLQKMEWQTITANNGIAGLALLETHQPMVIILDLMMAKMDGFDFILHLQLHSVWKTIPIIVLTSKDLTQDDRARLQGYVTYVFQKGGYTQDELLYAINAFMYNQPL